MTDPVTLGFIMNILLGLACYLLKGAHSDLKDDNRALWKEIGYIRDKYYKKEDFSEFKQELWARLDRMEDDFKQQIQDMSK